RKPRGGGRTHRLPGRPLRRCRHRHLSPTRFCWRRHALAAQVMTAPREVVLNYPVEVGGARYTNLTMRSNVAATRLKRGNGPIGKLAYLFAVSPAVIYELDETDIATVSERLSAYLADLES